MKILICDDEQPARERLRHLLDEIGHTEVFEAENGRQALERVAELEPDALLLDIRMPEVDGLAVARELARQPEPPAVIFTTAFDQYALEAFRTHAVDYLLKPVRPEDLAEALRIARRPTRAQLDALDEDAEEDAGRRFILSTLGGQRRLIAVDAIRYFQAEDKYVTVYHADGESVIDESLKQLEAELGERFLRIHRNALVALAAITGLEKGPGNRTSVILDDGSRIAVSRRHLAEVRRQLEQYR